MLCPRRDSHPQDPRLYATYANTMIPILNDDDALAEALDLPRVLALVDASTPNRNPPPVREVDEVPFACGPVTQYHHATLADGRPGFVVCRNHWNQPFAAFDLLVLRALAKVADASRCFGTADACSNFAGLLSESVHREADLEVGGEMLREAARAFRGCRRVAVACPVEGCAGGDALVLSAGGARAAELSHGRGLRAVGATPGRVAAGLAELARVGLAQGLVLRAPLSGGGVGALDDSVLGTRRGLLVVSGAAFARVQRDDARAMQDALVACLHGLSRLHLRATRATDLDPHEGVTGMQLLMHYGGHGRPPPQGPASPTLPLFAALQTGVRLERVLGHRAALVHAMVRGDQLFGCAALRLRGHRGLGLAGRALYYYALWVPCAWLGLWLARCQYRLGALRRAFFAVVRPPPNAAPPCGGRRRGLRPGAVRVAVEA